MDSQRERLFLRTMLKKFAEDHDEGNEPDEVHKHAEDDEHDKEEEVGVSVVEEWQRSKD